MDAVEDKAEEKNKLQHSSSSVVAVGIKGNKKSKNVLQWALKKFVPEGRIMFKLIHVHAGIKGVPTPMGNVIPISQVRSDVANAFRQEVEWQKSQMLLPYKNMCEQRKVYVETVLIESDDVAAAIAEEIAKGAVTKLVIGASSRSIFSSKLKGMAAKISVCTPRFCTVYAISKGKLSSIRPSDIQIDESFVDDSSKNSCSTSSSNYTSTSQTDSASVASYAPLNSSSLTEQRFQALSSINQTVLSTNPSFIESNHSRCQSLDLGTENIVTSLSARNSSFGYGLSRVPSCKSIKSDTEYWIHDHNSTMDVSPATESPSPGRQENINLELEKLRIELRHAQGMHAMALSENIDASRKLNDLSKRRSEELMKLEEIIAKEELTKELVRQERGKYEASKREADYLKECAEREAAERREMEMKAIHAAQEKEKLESALSGSTPQYLKFTWDEIVSATSSFSEDLRIGMGAYGTVYKGNLHHTVVAVKALHSKGGHKSKQFQQELDILSRIRHPHLLLLLGACPDNGCLVYEYMENGSLEDRLFRKNSAAPIPWYERYRIAWEVASALSFLHSSRPTPIIHRDLKPANILLDSNLVSKIGDIGLSTMLQTDALSTMYKDTEPVGTLCYIDPEYQRSGLISPKSDVYAFGMVILQLLTAKPAIALTHVVETAVDFGKLADILDPEAGSWPLQETLDLARLGLRCAELRLSHSSELQKMAGRREGFCGCGAPLGVPHYCQANSNWVGNQYRAPPPCNNWAGYGAPNVGYYRQQSRPVTGGPYYGGGNKRALLCGITYGKGRHALKGSVNDVLLMKSFLVEILGFHPDSIFVLRDDQYNNPKTIPTKANMIEAMKLLVNGSKAGDSLVFHYSGHGSRVEDDNMDEIDGYDEALCPVDYEDAGKIRDDIINDVLVKPLPHGTKLHAIIDTCSSGTVLDLPFMCRMNRLGQYKWEDHVSGKPHYKWTNGGFALCISACDDDGSSGDTTAFGMNGGALTHSFIQAMRNQPGLSYGHLLHSMRSIILGAKEEIGLNAHQQQFHINHRRHYAHEPQLSSSERFDIHSRRVVI